MPLPFIPKGTYLREPDWEILQSDLCQASVIFAFVLEAEVQPRSAGVLIRSMLTCRTRLGIVSAGAVWLVGLPGASLD